MQYRRDLRFINLKGVDFSNSELSHTSFEGADLEKSDFHDTSLRGCNFNDTNLNHAKFNQAWLQGSTLRRAKLINADLTGADLSNSQMDQSILIDAILPDAKLQRTNLNLAQLNRANLEHADLWGAYLNKADLSGANLYKADLDGAELIHTILLKTNLENADLRRVNFENADLSGAILINAILNHCIFIKTDLSKANLTGAKIYGISTWDIKTDKYTIMKDLTISENPLIKVDDIEVGQFINMINDNKKISNIFTAMKTQSALILGSFGRKEKETLVLIKRIISKIERNYVPIIFDFNSTKLQTLIDTINVLSLLSRFIVIDLTRPAGQLLELAQFDKLQIPYALILSNKAEHVPRNVEKYILSEWCYKKELIPYSDKDKEKELKRLINDIAIWAEKINEKYKKDLINSKNNIKELNEILHKRNKGKK